MNFFKFICFTLFIILNSVVLSAQGCVDFSSNDQNSKPIEFKQFDCINIIKNTTIGELDLGEDVTINIPEGVTFTVNNNVISNTDNSLVLTVEGTLNFIQKPTIEANVIFDVRSTGKVNIGYSGDNNLELKGLDNMIFNEGIFNVGVIDFVGGTNSINVIDNLASGKFNVNRNINIQGFTTFRNYGLIEIGETYNNNSSSVYINCGTLLAKVGFNLNGGKVLNTGKFIHGSKDKNGSIELGNQGSLLKNYGELISYGILNLRSNDTIYNEGRLVLNKFEPNGRLIGPESDDKLGYVYITNRVESGPLTIGPNLEFRKINSIDDLTNYITNTTDKTIFKNQPIYFSSENKVVSSPSLAGVSYGCTTCKAKEITNISACFSLDGNLENYRLASCTKSPNREGRALSSFNGISTFSKQSEGWPYSIPNAHLVLSSSNKGFVLTRTEENKIKYPVEGMLIYDVVSNCLKLYTSNGWNCISKTCNDE